MCVCKSAGSIIKINALLYTKHISGPAYNELKAMNLSDKDMKKKYKGTNISPFTDLCAQKINEIASDDSKTNDIGIEIAGYLDATNKAITHTHTPLHATWAMPITHSMVTLTKMIN